MGDVSLTVGLSRRILHQHGELKAQAVVCYHYILLQTVEKQHNKGHYCQHDNRDDERRAFFLALSAVKFGVV